MAILDRKLLPLLVFLTTSIFLFSQPPLVRNDLWRVGDTDTYFALDVTNLEAGPAGNGVTWDFSQVVSSQENQNILRYIEPSQAPDVDSFPGTNFVLRTEVEPTGFIDVFSNVSDSGILDLGQSTPQGLLFYSDNRQVLTFPFHFNTTQMDDFQGSLTSSVQGITTRLERSGSITTTYDGFGTLLLGDKTYPQVRRSKQVQVVTDVITVLGIAAQATSTTTTYSYLSPSFRTPVLQYVELELNVNGQITMDKTGAILNVDDNPQSPISGRYAAHLTNQTGNFATEIIIQNPDNQAQMLTLQPFGANGSPLDEVVLNLGPSSTSRMLQQNLFPAEAAGFRTSGCDNCIFTTGYRALLENASTAHVHQTSDLKSTYYFYPGEWDLLFDGAAIVNAGFETAIVEASQIGDDGVLIEKITLAPSLAPGAKFLDVFNGKFANIPNAIIKLESSQPLAVMILRISQDQRYLYQNLALPQNPDLTGTRWIAHITSNTGGFQTSILAHNTSDDEKMITIHPYSQTGEALTPVDVTLSANQVLRMTKAELLPEATSHAAISGSSDCIVSVGYQSLLANASTAHIHESPAIGNAFSIYPGEWDLLFDGLALINTGASGATITASQIRDNSEVLATVTLVDNLAPNAKFLTVLEGLFTPTANTSIRIEATQPLAILALRLSKDSRFLYGNLPIPR